MTDEELQYKNAPIVEAIIDFRFRYSVVPTRKALLSFVKTIANDFPDYEDLTSIFMEARKGRPGEQTQFKQVEEFVGYKLFDIRHTRIVQITKHGFTYSQLAPYCGWITFRMEAQTWLKRFADAFQIEAVTRRAVRYINKVEIPHEIVEPEDYFLLHPHVPKMKVFENMHQCAMQIAFEMSDIKAVAQIQQAFMGGSAPSTVAAVLDIDIFSDEEILGSDIEHVWNYCDLLRQKKNALFESSITQQTRDLIA